MNGEAEFDEEKFMAIVERRLHEQELHAQVAEILSEDNESAAPLNSDDAHDEDLAAWLKEYLRDDPDMLAMTLQDEDVRANAEAILGESIEVALGLKSNGCRMRLSVDPIHAATDEELRNLGLTRQLINDCEIFFDASPVLHPAARARFWIHYRESIC